MLKLMMMIRKMMMKKRVLWKRKVCLLFSSFIIFIMTFENLAQYIAVHSPMSSNPRNTAISPHTGTSMHLSHCDNSGNREKNGGVVGGKHNKSTAVEKNHLKKKQRHNGLIQVTWFRIAATLRPHDLCEPVHVCLRPLTLSERLRYGPRCTGKTIISLLLTMLNCI